MLDIRVICPCYIWCDLGTRGCFYKTIGMIFSLSLPTSLTLSLPCLRFSVVLQGQVEIHCSLVLIRDQYLSPVGNVLNLLFYSQISSFTCLYCKTDHVICNSFFPVFFLLFLHYHFKYRLHMNLRSPDSFY